MKDSKMPPKNQKPQSNSFVLGITLLAFAFLLLIFTFIAPDGNLVAFAILLILGSLGVGLIAFDKKKINKKFILVLLAVCALGCILFFVGINVSQPAEDTSSNTTTESTPFEETTTAREENTEKETTSKETTVESTTDESTTEDTTSETTTEETTTEKEVETTSAQNKLRVTSVSSPVSNGSTASLSILGKPNTEYKISVYYKTTKSKAKGLEPAKTNKDGKLTWSWKVGTNTTEGSHRIVVSGGGESVTVYFNTIE